MNVYHANYLYSFSMWIPTFAGRKEVKGSQFGNAACFVCMPGCLAAKMSGNFLWGIHCFPAFNPFAFQTPNSIPCLHFTWTLDAINQKSHQDHQPLWIYNQLLFMITVGYIYWKTKPAGLHIANNFPTNIVVCHQQMKYQVLLSLPATFLDKF